jgi:Domain of unknown function (DUF4129)
MTRSSARRAAWSAAAVLMLVFLVALGSSRSLARVGGPGHLLRPQLIGGDLGVGFGVLALVVLGGLVYSLWPRRRRRSDDDPELVVEEFPAPWWEKALVLALAVVAAATLVTATVLVVRRAGQQAAPLPPPAPGVTGSHPAAHARAAVPVPPEGPFLVHWQAWGALAALGVVAVVIVAVRWRMGRPRDGPAARAVPRSLSAAIEESLAEIEREGDPRRAVIRAYVGMERVLTRHGLGRRPFETPQEYLARALSGVRVSRPAGDRLTRLFQRARFSEHPIAAQMKQDAITALAAVRDELAGERQ